MILGAVHNINILKPLFLISVRDISFFNFEYTEIGQGCWKYSYESVAHRYGTTHANDRNIQRKTHIT